jgi:cytochrome c oxidase assembly factor CtaG
MFMVNIITHKKLLILVRHQEYEIVEVVGLTVNTCEVNVWCLGSLSFLFSEGSPTVFLCMFTQEFAGHLIVQSVNDF